VTVAPSYAMIVRDAMLSRVKQMEFFSGFNFGTNKAESIQPENVPFAGIYFISEDLTPDGDANILEVRFRSTTTYGVSVIVKNNDGAEAEKTLDAAWQLLTTNLFNDPTLYDWKNLNVPGHAAIQAYTRGNRSHQFGSTGADNSIPIAELRFTLVCDLGVIDYPPIIEDDLKKIHVKTQFPGGDTQEDIDKRQQVVTEYDIEVES